MHLGSFTVFEQPVSGMPTLADGTSAEVRHHSRRCRTRKTTAYDVFYYYNEAKNNTENAGAVRRQSMFIKPDIAVTCLADCFLQPPTTDDDVALGVEQIK